MMYYNHRFLWLILSDFYDQTDHCLFFRQIFQLEFIFKATDNKENSTVYLLLTQSLHFAC